MRALAKHPIKPVRVHVHAIHELAVTEVNGEGHDANVELLGNVRGDIRGAIRHDAHGPAKHTHSTDTMNW